LKAIVDRVLRILSAFIATLILMMAFWMTFAVIAWLAVATALAVVIGTAVNLRDEHRPSIRPMGFATHSGRAS
jgi:hypothetical protein